MSENKKDKLGKTKIATGNFDRVTIDVIPPGQTWVIVTYGAGDIGTGDAMSSVYWLEWAGVPIADSLIVVTGALMARSGPWELVGDGVKKLEIYREKTSKDSKDMPWWIRMYKRA